MYTQDYKVFEDGRKIPLPKKDFTIVHDEKINQLKELVENLDGDQLLLCYEFKHDKERLKKAFPNMLFFGESAAKDKKLIEDWNEGLVKLAAGHPATISHGINIQTSGAFNLCFFNPTWVLEDYYQAIRRLKRRGNSAETIFVWLILAKDTVDEVVFETITESAADEQVLFDKLSTYAKGRGVTMAVPLQQDFFRHTVSKCLELDSSHKNSLRNLKSNVEHRVNSGAINTTKKLEAFIIKWLQVESRLRGGSVDMRGGVGADVKDEAAKLIAKWKLTLHK